MSEERKELYFYMVLGYTGLFLMGLATMRYIAVLQDGQGQVISMFGFLLTVAYIKHMEKRLSIRKKVIVLTNIIFTAGFSIVSFVLYF
ncbi:hypothetical protein ACFPU1_03305 [Thalassorhabdus alkalitolerans]|uniref:Uncharacterized protein n=1 Tax=Thalassorhabdus alkalitolerans TaxID=2282697 RepID=A0ABW0YNV4_9BACI